MSDKDTMTAKQYRDLPAGQKKRKYRNVPVVVDGIPFPSKLQARVYKALCLEYGEGNVICEVSLPLWPNDRGRRTRIRPDFMIIGPNAVAYDADEEERGIHNTWHAVRFIDAKGCMTKAWETKRDGLRDKYGIEIELRTK